MPSSLSAERLAVGVEEQVGEEAEAAPAEPPYRMPWTLGGLREVLHPYVGFVREVPPGDVHAAHDPLRALGFHFDRSPIPHPAGAEDFVVLVCGGSVAQAFEELGGAAALLDRLATLPGAAGKRVHVGSVAMGGFKQPQQLLAVTYLLSLGFRFDLVVNLDGFNEATLGPSENVPRHVASFFPRLWGLRVEDTPDRRRQSMMGETRYLRERRWRWARAFDRPLLRWSATAGLLWRLGDRRLAGRIAALERAIVEEAPGTQSWAIAPPLPAGGREQLVAEVVAVWRESSLQLSRLARANGARYFHFLQPNQYLANSKPMGDGERAIAVHERSPSQRWVGRVYPKMIAAGPDLRAAGVAFFDMTQVFAHVAEPLYTDNCCHFSPDGYRILGTAMAEAIAGDWDRPGEPAPGNVGARERAPASRAQQRNPSPTPTREERPVVGDSQVLTGHLREDGPEVRRHRQVAALVEGVGIEAGERAVHLPSVHGGPDDEQARGVAVVGAAGAVLGHGAPELGHGEEGHVVAMRPQVLPESGDAARQLAGALGEAAGGAPLQHVGVPATRLREGDLQTHPGPDQERDLAQTPAERRRWIVGGRPLEAGRPHPLEQRHRLEALAGGAP
jgi:hypothetical protein